MTREDSGIRPTTNDSSGAGSAEKRRSVADGDANGMLAAAGNSYSITVSLLKGLSCIRQVQGDGSLVD